MNPRILVLFFACIIATNYDEEKLEAQLDHLQKRQALIEEKAAQNELEANRSFLRSALHYVKKKTKYEKELSDRNEYPYKTTATKDEVLEHNGNDLAVHDYVKNIAKEDYEYNQKTLSMANEKLQLNNGHYKSFPWYLFVFGMVAVIAVVIVIVIVKTAKSGKKRSVIDENEYERF